MNKYEAKERFHHLFGRLDEELTYDSNDDFEFIAILNTIEQEFGSEVRERALVAVCI